MEYTKKEKNPKIIRIKLSPENEKNIGYRITNVGPGGKETVVREHNFVLHKKR